MMGRGWVYWVTIGWVWEPLKWLGRVMLWLVFFPLGLWRSLVHGRSKGENRRDRKLAR